MYFLYSKAHIWAINVQERKWKHDGSQWNISQEVLCMINPLYFQYKLKYIAINLFQNSYEYLSWNVFGRPTSPLYCKSINDIIFRTYSSSNTKRCQFERQDVAVSVLSHISGSFVTLIPKTLAGVVIAQYILLCAPLTQQW